MRELVNEDALRRVGITRISQQIFLAAAAHRVGLRTAKAPCAGIPKVFRLHVGVFGNVG